MLMSEELVSKERAAEVLSEDVRAKRGNDDERDRRALGCWASAAVLSRVSDLRTGDGVRPTPRLAVVFGDVDDAERSAWRDRALGRNGQRRAEG